MRYTDLPLDDRHPDDAALARFGEPAFELIDQPGLSTGGWESFATGSTVVTLGSGHYRENGDRLRGHVYTEVPGASRSPGLPDDRAALVHHLNYLVTNDRINQPDMPYAFASERWMAELERWRTDIHALAPSPDLLDIDGHPVTGICLHYGGYSATTVRTRGRVVTLAINDEDAAAVDTRIVHHPAPG